MVKLKQTGKWLRELRILNGLTQKKASELFGVKRSTYSCWECRYKRKILPKHVRDSDTMRMLVMQHPVTSTSFKHVVEEISETKKENIFERIKRWIKQLKNLLK